MSIRYLSPVAFLLMLMPSPLLASPRWFSWSTPQSSGLIRDMQIDLESGQYITENILTFNSRLVLYDPYAGGLFTKEILRKFDCNTKEFISPSGARSLLKKDDFNGYDIVGTFCRAK